MLYIYFDTGTSNTRAYLIDQYAVAASKSRKIGSKDAAIAGTNVELLKGMKGLYDQLLLEHDLSDVDIEAIYASGMATSPFGVKEVSHLPTPVSLEKLHSAVYTYFEPEYFQREINLIRGVKTTPEGFSVNRHTVHLVNNLRGEEMELFGVLAMLDTAKHADVVIVLPGSHTHAVRARNGVLCDILSCFSGELFHALSTSTILANSIAPHMEELDSEMVLLGMKTLSQWGMNRALYLVNTMQIFSKMSRIEKTSYLEGVVSGGVVRSLAQNLASAWQGVQRAILAGGERIVKVYELLLNNIVETTGLQIEVQSLIVPPGESLAARGFIELLKSRDSLNR